MKKFVAFVVLLAANAAVGQNPYQLKNLQASTRDVTTETATVNAWKLVAGGGVCHSLTSPADSMWCLGTTGYVYNFNPNTRQWDQQTAMGTNVVQLAVANADAIFALMYNSQCDTGDYEVAKWNGSSWPSQVNACFNVLAAGMNGQSALLAGITKLGQLWFSTDQGNSWARQGSSNNWAYVSLGTNGLGCAVDASQAIWPIGNGQLLNSLPGPSSINGTIVGCVWSDDPTVVLAWTSTGYVYSTPLENFATWQQVTGLSARRISGAYRYFLFSEDTNGNVYHWNVNAPTLTATFGGQWNVGLGCPDQAHPCNSTATHTVSHTMNFKSGHGYLGGLKQATDLFTHDIEVANITYNPSCDPFFGQQADQECIAEISATAFCNESHADVQQVDINYVVADSTDVMNFSYWIDDSGPMAVQQGPGFGYYLADTTNATIEACPVSDPVPECPAESPAVIEHKVQWWGGSIYEQAAYYRELNEMSASRNGLDSPYVYDSFYLAQQLPDGTLVNTICFPTPARITRFLDGSLDIPHCK